MAPSTAELIEHVPPIARYCREPLDDRLNALAHWEAAAEALVAPDDDDVYQALAQPDPETGRLAPFPVGRDAARIEEFLKANEVAFEQLRAGVACGQVQLPLPDEDDASESDTETVTPLVELHHAWFVLARWRIARGELAEAAAELVQLGRMTQMICRGAELTLHHLIGRIMTGMPLAGMRLLADQPRVARRTLAELKAALDAWPADGESAAGCLRGELCCYALGEIDRLPEDGSPDELVDELLDRHYQNGPLAGEGDVSTDDGRLAWRRRQMVDLLKGHPDPLDKVATAELLGRRTADSILDLRPGHRLNVVAHWRRAARAHRRRRFLAQAAVWPTQFRPAFPYEFLGPGEVARRQLGEIRVHLRKSVWEAMQPPDEAALKTARRRIHATPNPLGVLLADALSPTDMTDGERRFRQTLHKTRESIMSGLQD